MEDSARRKKVQRTNNHEKHSPKNHHVNNEHQAINLQYLQRQQSSRQGQEDQISQKSLQPGHHLSPKIFPSLANEKERSHQTD